MNHYYGDIVRKLFIAGALIMVAMLPIFGDEISEPLFISLIAILGVSVAAGLTSPIHFWTAFTNVTLSMIGFVIFEWYAVDIFRVEQGATPFFIVNQALAILFLVAFYYSVKTLRGMQDSNKEESS